jgi:hypothetical protein
MKKIIEFIKKIFKDLWNGNIPEDTVKIILNNKISGNMEE